MRYEHYEILALGGDLRKYLQLHFDFYSQLKKFDFICKFL